MRVFYHCCCTLPYFRRSVLHQMMCMLHQKEYPALLPNQRVPALCIPASSSYPLSHKLMYLITMAFLIRTVYYRINGIHLKNSFIQITI